MTTLPPLPSETGWMRNHPPAAEWLDRALAVFDAQLSTWQLTMDGGWYSGGTVSLVAPVRMSTGAGAVLKLQWPHRESEHEAAALGAWGGTGAVHLLDHDTKTNAILMERCEPGHSAADADPDDGLAALSRVASALRSAVPSGQTFQNVEGEARHWQAGFLENWERTGRPFERALLDVATAYVDELLATPTAPALIHQDLHAGNVLDAGERGWLAIDPKPLLGDPALGVAAAIRGPELGLDRASVLHRLDHFAHELDLDRERVRRWAVVQTLAWCFDTPFRDSMLDVVRWLEAV